jgi:hypothetical protein
MNCPKCGYDGVPDGARFCPNCGESLPGAPQPSTQVSVTQEVGSVAGGQVTGLEVGQLVGQRISWLKKQCG